MTVLIAVLVVGAGSLLFRVVPLLGARHLPDPLTNAAGLAGLAVIAALSVRAVLHHEDAGIVAAPLVAAISIGVGLVLAFRGRSVATAVAAGLATYVVLAAALPSPA
ncbi:MAG: AzlD domain-containing protein [Nocardioides sp.]